jgi:hypothetical protein
MEIASLCWVSVSAEQKKQKLKELQQGIDESEALVSR